MQQIAFEISSRLWSWLASQARGTLGPVALWQLCLVPVLFAIAVLACLPNMPARRWCNYAFFCATPLTILLGVLPSLSKDYLNPDEPVFVAAARKLAFDPIFYRSVDTESSGPFNIYVLTVPAWFGGPITYVSARLTGAVLMFGFVLCLYACCAAFLGQRSARLAILPLIGVIVLSSHFDFVHYSSERLSLFLTGVSLVLLSRQYLGRGNYPALRMFTLGLISAAMCFSKLQFAPIALTMAFAALLYGWLVPRGRSRGIVALALGAGVVFAAFCAIFLHYGVFTEFWESYVAQNLTYGERTGHSLPEKILEAVRVFLAQGEFRWHNLGLALCGVVIVLERQRRQKWTRSRTAYLREPSLVVHQWLRHGVLGKVPVPVAFVLLLLIASVYAVARPGIPHEHYLLLLIAPWTLCVALGISWASKGDIVAGSSRLFVLLAFALPTALRIASDQPASYENFAQYAAEAAPLVRIVRYYASEQEPLVVWGWRSELNVRTNMLQGTRFGNSTLQLASGPLVPFFRMQYLRDFLASNPPLFLDAVGPGNFKFSDRGRVGHETFPELSYIIQSKYSLVADVEGVRVYVRNDRWRCCLRL